jgi:hypothetical protein
METSTSLDLTEADPADNGWSAVNQWIITPYRPSDAAAWKAFLADSNNGTLFHDLDFLDYHPSGKYDFRHLIASRANGIEALLPGAVSEDGVFVSLAGASIGGPVVKTSISAEACLHLVEALQLYCRSVGWRGIEVTLPPPIYHDEPDQKIEFALHRSGFELVHRSMPLLIPLDGEKGDRFQHLFRQRQRSYVRANRRKGVLVCEAGIDGLDSFLALFAETYARLQATPTHSADEIEFLLKRLPERVRIWSAQLGGITVASVLLFVLNRKVCNTFYICDRSSHRELHGVTLVMAEAADRLARCGFRYLDLGPSASSKHFNKGVAHFKESLGARPFCRDSWRWRT